MADIFISYSREDRAQADLAARALQTEGFEVFWDSEIPPGQTWADYIEERLTECKVVLVLWSANSTKSQWVREEARMGRDKGKLIPVMIDNSPAPFGFGEVQAANLTGWSGDVSDHNWRRVVEAVRYAMSREPSAAARPAMAAQGQPSGFRPPKPEKTKREKKGGMPAWAWALVGAVGAFVALVIIGLNVDDDGTTPSNDAGQLQQAMSQPSQQPAQPSQPAQQQPQLSEAEYMQQLATQMAQMQQNMAREGFSQVGAPTNGALAQGAMDEVPATLYVGYDYRIAAVCDSDCSDIDLVLLAGDGSEISRDNETDDHPVVPVHVTGSGRFTLQVHMYRCSVEPCYYSTALFQRASGSR